MILMQLQYLITENFLKKTCRLHPTIYSFISKAFYQSRLIANNENLKRKYFEDKTSKNLITSE